MEALDKKKAKTAEKIAKKANAIMLKAYRSLLKELDAYLKSNDVWYCSDEVILDHDEFRKPNDRNADQMVIDHFLNINDGCFNGVVPSAIWFKDNLKASKEAK